jgi:hypothetical protein
MMTFGLLKRRVFKLISVSSIRPLAVAVFLVVILVYDPGLNNNAQSQLLLFPKAHYSDSSNNNNSTSQSYQRNQPLIQSPNLIKQSPPKLHLVKIISPIKGQQVATNKDLVVIGTSRDNATSGCIVSIKANGFGPYHNAQPSGNLRGSSDYSKWNFTLTPAYTTIKQGQNKITAKFACSSNPLVVSHYSVNVTGVNAFNDNTTSSSNPQYEPSLQQLSSNETKPLVNSLNKNVTNTSTRSVVSNSKHLSTSSAGVSKNSHGTSALLALSIGMGKSPGHPGDTQTISVAVTDKNSSKPIAGASVLGNISSSAGLYKKFNGTTDSKGLATYSWTVGTGDKTGKYKLVMQGYAPNYQSNSALKIFGVTSAPAVTSPSNTNSPASPDTTTSNNYNVLTPPALTTPPAAAPSTTHTKTKTHHHLHSTTNPNP